MGDEIHFLTECVSHSEYGNILFDKIIKEIPNFLIMSNHEKTISILTEQNMNVLLSLERNIVKACGLNIIFKYEAYINMYYIVL